MATQAPTPAAMPLLYNGLEPLNAGQHGKMKLKQLQTIPQAGRVHAVPVTIEEFAHVQRHYPIIFSSGDDPIPLALMGLNEGVNAFIDENGHPIDKNVYMPAYLRRYPFMLARLQQDSDELSLCFDPTCGAIVEGDEGDALFDGDQPSELTQSILKFCESFEAAGQKTQAFMQELKKLELLMEGEVSVQPEGADQPFIYRGFKMVDEEKLRDMRGDELRKISQNGILPLLYSHLFSLPLIREVFHRQMLQGKTGMAPTAAADPGAAKKESNGADA